MKKYLSILLFCLISFNNICFSNEQEFSLIESDRIYSPTECYTIIKQLGEGAFGKVYEVENTEGEKFALKSYKNITSDKDSFLDLFKDAKREFLRGQILDHPHIIKSYDLFNFDSPTDGLTTNLVLQFVPGNTILNTKRGTLSKEDVLAASAELCSALQYAWTFDYIYLDLHENNIMLSDQAQIMVVDLASFFTLDEIFGVFNNQVNNKSSSKSVNAIQAAVHQFSGKFHKGCVKQGESENNERIHQFFLQHPKLFNQLLECRNEVQTDKGDKFQFRAETNPRSLNTAEVKEMQRAYFGSHYFNQVTDMCSRIIVRADLSRDEKFELRAEIKKVAWHMEEDFDEGQLMPIETYFDREIEVLSSLK